MSTKNLPPVYRFDFGDYTQLGGPFQKFLGNLNIFTRSVFSSLNGNLGFSNMERAIYNFSIVGGRSSNNSFSFSNPLAIAPNGISIIKINVTNNLSSVIAASVCAANWDFDGKNINILTIVGLTSGVSYDISLEVR